MSKDMNRRDFLGVALSAAGFAAAGGCASAGVASGGAGGSSAGGVKFCVFADIHYFPGTYPHSNIAWLERILSRARGEMCDMVIHCGDFCHHPARDREYIAAYSGCGIPAYHVIGNHDDDGNEHAATLDAYGLARGYYHFDRGGFRFIVTDPNYIRWHDGRVEHYSHGNYFRKTDDDVIGVVPDEQLAWLARTIEDSPHPCIVFSHQSFERNLGSCCSNGAEVRAIFNRANAKVPGRVRLVVNGHHHCDHLRILDGIVYFDVNSASYQWLGSKFRHNLYSEAYRRENSAAHHIIGWDDPLSAIVTIGLDGRLKIEGSRSVFTEGVTPEMCGKTMDLSGRLITPAIQSVDLAILPSFRFC